MYTTATINSCKPLIGVSHEIFHKQYSLYGYLKVPGPISQNGDFYSNDASPPNKSWFQIWLKSVKQFGYKKRLCICDCLYLHCVSLIMVTITSHIFINTFQTVHFPAVKFTRGIAKNTSFLLIPRSLKVWEKSEVIGPGSFKLDQLYEFVYKLSWPCTKFINFGLRNGWMNKQASFCRNFSKFF